MSFHVPEKFRYTAAGHRLSSDSSYGNNGLFAVKLKHNQAVKEEVPRYKPDFGSGLLNKWMGVA